jgi:hypothetical protein
MLLQASYARWGILMSSRHTVIWELLIIPDRAGEVVACCVSLSLVVAWKAGVCQLLSVALRRQLNFGVQLLLSRQR